MLVVKVSAKEKDFVELHILNVTDQYYPKGESGEDKVKYYRIMNIYGKPTFQVMDNSRWDKVVIPDIQTVIKAYKKQG